VGLTEASCRHNRVQQRWGGAQAGTGKQTALARSLLVTRGGCRGAALASRAPRPQQRRRRWVCGPALSGRGQPGTRTTSLHCAHHTKEQT